MRIIGGRNELSEDVCVGRSEVFCSRGAGESKGG